MYCRMGWLFTLTIVTLGLALTDEARADDRTIDGTNNNLTHPTWGSANIDLIRAASHAYPDDGATLAGQDRPNPRALSNAIFSQADLIDNTHALSAFTWMWGQFLDHDISLTPDDSGESANITPPADDPWFGADITFHRSRHDGGNPRQHPNVITAFIDASNVYGSDPTRADFLRTGAGGRMKTTTTAEGDLLPFNTAGLPNAGGDDNTALFIAGDIRANENVALTSLHTLFVREHNRLADQLAASNPTWTDEQIYQRARKLVGAEMQAITYNEFLPALLGDDALGSYSGYDDTVNPSILSEFSTAAFRVGHTMLTPRILRYDEHHNEIDAGHLALMDAFFRPDRLMTEGGIDPILRGAAYTPQQEVDAQVIDDVRNFLFGPPGSGGLDLVTLNIQRGRDHGLTDYNTVRQAFGLSPVLDFDQITDNTALADTLAAMYGDVSDIDPWVGMLAEDHYRDAAVGETIFTILVQQFEALRDGDRFFYLNDSDLTADDLAMLESTTLADIISHNTGVAFDTSNVFAVSSIPQPATLATLAIVGLLAVARRR